MIKFLPIFLSLLLFSCSQKKEVAEQATEIKEEKEIEAKIDTSLLIGKWSSTYESTNSEIIYANLIGLQ